MSVPYNNTTPEDKPKARNKFGIPEFEQSFKDPLAKPYNRTIAIIGYAILASGVLAIPSPLFEDEGAFHYIMMAIAFLVGVSWAGVRLRKGLDQPFVLQQVFIRFLLPIVVTVLAVFISAGFSIKMLFIGLGMIVLATLALQFMPFWVYPLTPQLVYHHVPLFGEPGFRYYVPNDPKSDPSHIWISSRDSLFKVWKLDDAVEANLVVNYAITSEGYPIALDVRLNAFFDPQQISDTNFKVEIVKAAGQGKGAVVAELIKRLDNALDITAQMFFINMPHQQALASGSVVTFRERLPALIHDRISMFGLRLDPASVVCIPYGTDEAMNAVSRAAAAPYNTTAALSVQKELLRQAMSGDVSAQLVLYAQMVARGGNDINFLPDITLPNIDNPQQTAQRFLQAVKENPGMAQELFSRFFGVRAEDISFRDVPSASMPPQTPASPPGGIPSTPPKASEPAQKPTTRPRRRTFNFGDKQTKDSEK